jgi:hypothetical protein
MKNVKIALIGIDMDGEYYFMKIKYSLNNNKTPEKVFLM